MFHTNYHPILLYMVGAALAQNSFFYDPLNHPIYQLSPDPTVAFNLENSLSLANNGGANSGEVLRIATQINSTDEESIYTAYYPVAEGINALAESIDPAIDPVGARENYFHAASYYRGAAFFLIGDQSDPRLISLWDQQLTAFNKAVALLKPAPGEPFTVRAISSSIGSYDVPGYFNKASACNATKLPTVLVVTGYDGSQQESYHSSCIPLISRGINCVTYEGPGQPTPLVDYILNRPDVEPTKIVHMGISFGGILAPITVAQDPRVSSLIVNDGIVNLQTDLITQFGPLAEPYLANKTVEFDEYVTAFIEDASTPINDKWIVQQGLYALNTKSPSDWFTRLGEIALTSTVISNISQRPVYVAEGQDDTILLNQSSEAYELFKTQRPNGTNLTYFQELRADLGAGEHCAISAETQIWADITRWLSGLWSEYKIVNNL